MSNANCKECNGSRQYLPLMGPAEPCRACCGDKVAEVCEAPTMDDTDDNEDECEIENYIVIDGEKCEVLNWDDNGEGAQIETDQGDYYIFAHRNDAEAATREYWEDMARINPSEFAEIVGKDTLVSWALGQAVQTGSSVTFSLEEWLDAVSNEPEYHLAGYDHEECDVNSQGGEWLDDLDFKPTLAYRFN